MLLENGIDGQGTSIMFTALWSGIMARPGGGWSPEAGWWI